MQDELQHYGVMGMKWGVRRYQNPDGSLTSRGIKKYAKKGYAADHYNANKTVLGRAYDKYTGAHKIAADIEYNLATPKQRKNRAESYVKADKKYETAIQKTKASYTKREKRITKLMGRGYDNMYAASRNAGYSKGRSAVNAFMTGELGKQKLKNIAVSKQLDLGLAIKKDGYQPLSKKQQDYVDRYGINPNAQIEKKQQDYVDRYGINPNAQIEKKRQGWEMS